MSVDPHSNSHSPMSIKLVLKNTVFYALANAIQKSSNFLILFIAAMFLNTKEYGYLAFIHLFSNLAYTIVISTTHGSTLRFYVDLEGEKRKKFIGSILIFVLSFGLIFFLFISIQGQSLVSALFPNSNLPFYPLFAMSLGIMFFTIPQPIVNSIFRIKEKPKQILILVILSSTIIVMFIYIFLGVLHLKLKGLLTGHLLASLIIFWLFFYMIRKEFFLKFDWKLLKPALIFSLPLIPYIFMDFVRSRIGIYILEKSVEMSEVGLYYFGVTMGMAMNAIVSTFAAAYSPRMFNLLKEKPLRIAKAEFSKIFLYIYLLMTLAFVSLSFFSEEIILLIFSDAYYDSYKIIPIIVLSCFTGGVYLFFHNSFYWTKKTYYTSLCALIMACITILAQILLIPPLGIMGAAFGLLLGQVAGLISGYILGQKVFPMNYGFKNLAYITSFAVACTFILGYLWPGGFSIWKIVVKILLILVLLKITLSKLDIDYKSIKNRFKDLLGFS